MFCNILLKKIHVFGFTSNYRQRFCLQFGNISGKNTLFAFTSMHAAHAASAVSISAKKICRPRTPKAFIVHETKKQPSGCFLAKR